ncbi:protein LATERAL ROOT PRIMORDIUM 1-like isoform X1 [Papaver somniferum]|uniref:protein LATERAL ROOT PRIMORDIUM 1-like isoform X1 n=1 Tax=Papaver somniferum TaxID=3469 RepID=UPI000E6FC633|nr:protein LATERAL ROOT PRIMORDIUM 1-like isoform X1 [Papaver somniferum]
MGMVGLRSSDVLFVAPASSFQQHQQNHHHQDPFYAHDHHHHQQQNPMNNSGNNNNSPTALGIGVIPLLTTSVSTQLWQNQQTHHNVNYPVVKKPVLINYENSLDQSNISIFNNNNHNSNNNNNHGAGNVTIAGFAGGADAGNNANLSMISSSSTKTCHDCGNQAKKDCSHNRCRTCCKSRGYDCSTHIKSTWVSASRRRDRQLISPLGNNDDQQQGDVGGGTSSGSTSGVKKPRLVPSQNQTASHTSTSNNNTPPRSFDTSSSHHHQDASFREALPKQVHAPAAFKCVRVSPIGDGEEEIAYQAIVKIGGHVFKGFLYNKGIVSGNEGLPNISELHLGGSGKNWPSSSQIIDHSDVYGGAATGLLGSGGMSFGIPAIH